MSTLTAEPGSLNAAPLASGSGLGAIRSGMPRVMLVDDEDEFRDSLSGQLMDEGCIVTSFSSGRAALDYLVQTNLADVCLLDWRMPGMSGIEVLRELRRRGILTPVIFLTGLRDDAFEEEALRDGAVDFVNKARRLSVLLKRIEIISSGKRLASPPPQNAQTNAHLRRGPLDLDLDVHSAKWHGRPIELTRSEFRILALLAGRPGIDVAFGDLYRLAHENAPHFSDEEGYRANVRSLVKRIRNKFRAVDPAFDRIQSYARFGYRWSMR